MTVVIQRKRVSDLYLVPAGGEVLWYGIAASLPPNYVIDSYMANVFVKGASVGGASNTPSSSDSHTHTNPASTGTEAAHTHPVGAPSVGNASGSTTTYGASNASYANASHGHGGSASTSGSGGGHSHTLASVAAANLFPPYKKLYLIKATVDAEFPIGGIVMLNASIANRPLKTQLCNGANDTLDLRDYFVYGAAVDGDVGVSGGAATHTHNNVDTGAAGSHSHTTAPVITGTGNNTNMASEYAGTQVSAGGHGHSWGPTTGVDADHVHTLGVTGSGSNLPPYLKLYFVQRTV
jgi:hypothetical protein